MEVVIARASRALNDPRLLVAGLCLVVLALAAAAVLLFRQYVDERSDQALRVDVLQAARQQVVNFTTLDYRRFDQDSQRLLAGSTGDFAEQYSSSSAQLKDLVTKNKTVSKGKVLEAGVVSADHDSARVLVVADSEVTNTASEEPMSRHYRMQIDLVRQGERWLATDMQFVG
jgi:Mce-associated membrane protein